MRRTAFGSFLLSFLINLLLNIWGAVPAAILLVLHFAVGLALWLTFAAPGLWVAGVAVTTLIFHLIGRTPAPPERVQRNVNPYSPENMRKKGAQTDLRKIGAAGNDKYLE